MPNLGEWDLSGINAATYKLSILVSHKGSLKTGKTVFRLPNRLQICLQD